ncbi:hypothetical protein HK098_006546 [Nowakowskiella sp. JEL0407]|nr:hypothetical protein HK098_006546 [Nowakowskiella sp. JEL0407]
MQSYLPPSEVFLALSSLPDPIPQFSVPSLDSYRRKLLRKGEGSTKSKDNGVSLGKDAVNSRKRRGEGSGDQTIANNSKVELSLDEPLKDLLVVLNKMNTIKNGSAQKKQKSMISESDYNAISVRMKNYRARLLKTSNDMILDEQTQQTTFTNSDLPVPAVDHTESRSPINHVLYQPPTIQKVPIQPNKQTTLKPNLFTKTASKTFNETAKNIPVVAPDAAFKIPTIKTTYSIPKRTISSVPVVDVGNLVSKIQSETLTIPLSPASSPNLSHNQINAAPKKSYRRSTPVLTPPLEFETECEKKQRDSLCHVFRKTGHCSKVVCPYSHRGRVSNLQKDTFDDLLNKIYQST